jgi:hypothetical protein
MAEGKNANFGLPPTKDDEIAALKKQLADANAKLIASGAGEPAEALQDLDSQGFEKVYVKLNIAPGQRVDDPTHVPLGINGYVVKVERGVDVIIHKAFADVLKNAVEDITLKGDGGLITRPALRFPYQILGPATEDEYQAFKAKMKSGASAAVVRA